MDKKTDLIKTEEKNIQKARELYELSPAVDIYENHDEILLHADMPGVLQQDVSVNIDNGTLSLSGTRRLKNRGRANWEEFGDVNYVRKFSVPQTIDVEKVEADLKDGVLKLHLPKSESARPKRIEIKTA